MLTLLGACFLALLALSALGASGRAPRGVFLGSALAGAGLGLVGLVGLPATALAFGPPWGAAQVAVDALAGWFLVILAVAAVPACLFAAASPPPPRAEGAAFPLFLAGMALTLIAADGFTLVLGFELMSLASWALVAARHATGAGRRAARLYLAFAAFSGLCLIGAVGLLAAGGGLGFGAMRAAPPEGWRAAAVLALVLVGAGSKAGLVPFHVWLPLAHPAAASPVSALMSGAMVKIALYVMIRLIFDLSGPAQPAWWGLPLVGLGVATALIGALRANLERDTKAILACSTLENMGLMVAGLGLALAYRGADLLPLASVALAAALLHALNHAAFKTQLFLALGAVYSLAGSRDPDRLGGLIHRMPWVAGCALLGALSAAALPPLSGFASEWLLLQALIQGFRAADMSVQLIAAVSLAAVGMAVGLAAAAMVRLFGLVFLGRPRTPRVAGAPDASGLMRVALVVPSLLTLALGPLAAVALGLLDAPIGQVLGPQAAAPRFGLELALGDGGSRYLPGLAALLLALAVGGLVLAVRLRSPREPTRGPAWDCGFLPPPPHMPFGDPLSQVSAMGLGQPIRRSLGDLAIAPREWLANQPPGSPAPAMLRVEGRDRGFTRLLHPLARARRALSREAEKLRGLSLRFYLGLTFGTLVALLALVAILEHG
ncbi:proton-conducting transporter membrane subunit [Sediminicoccus sp. BL-A-41-H5]|uniref:proton-conducting transporter transmembrane domain-containing protein n=1 Tax=Sediminicoccus sp. BL-A-41-H5 TaxID=3421106 RepID=UPI003D67742F